MHPAENRQAPLVGHRLVSQAFQRAGSGRGGSRYYLGCGRRDGMRESVWLNGELVGGWPYGYSSRRVDLTPHLKPGAENVLAIRLDNPPASSRWYPGGGLYRNVWLVKTSPVHVGQWGNLPSRRPRSLMPRPQLISRPPSKTIPPRPLTCRVTTRIFQLFDAKGSKTGAVVASAPSVTRTIAANAAEVIEGGIDRRAAEIVGREATQTVTSPSQLLSKTARSRTVVAKRRSEFARFNLPLTTASC